LHHADVVAIFKQVGSKAVTEGVATDRLGQPGSLYSPFDGFLQAAFINVMAA
jgi:hypothetical protein